MDRTSFRREEEIWFPMNEDQKLKLYQKNLATVGIPNYYTGKVICVDNAGNPELYTVGKIYEFIDGYMLQTDQGKKTETYKPFWTFNEFQQYSSSKFIEYKGEPCSDLNHFSKNC